MRDGPRLAVFVSPHGFGHAARASALMGAVHGLTGARFELFATTPTWFFDESVEGLYRYHGVVTDVGLHQRSALEHDAAATASSLDNLLPFREAALAPLVEIVRESGCSGVICDIAPMGIAVAEAAGVPSILVENFTWPWLYEPMYEERPALRSHGAALAHWFARATFHIQTEPLCRRDEGADAWVPPMARRPRASRAAVRARLGLPDDARVVLLTMGGVPEELPFLAGLADIPDVTFVVTGAPRTVAEDNLRLFHGDTRLYMPDLIRASDAVVAKAGYSTIAEVWREGRPMAFVTREDFRETGPLRAWLTDNVPGFEIPGGTFAGGDWLHRVPELLAMDGGSVERESGAESAARFVVEALGLGRSRGVSP